MKGFWFLMFSFLCVFAAGVFFGVWLDWSAWHSKVGTRNLFYQVQDYPMANLLVNPGDTITLIPPPGGDSTGLTMNFIGYSPCIQPLPPIPPTLSSNPCVIDPNITSGPYLFTCSSMAGYTCPDPGIQQPPTVPIEDITYFGFLKADFHLAPVPSAGPATPAHKTTGTHPSAAASVTAYVSCQNGSTVLQDTNGKSITTINATNPGTVYWISAKPFTLDTSKFPAGLCSPAMPPSTPAQEMQCDVSMSKQSVSYSLQAVATPACNPMPNAMLVTQ